MTRPNRVENGTVCSMIQTIAKLHPRATAVDSAGSQLTYTELDSASGLFSQSLTNNYVQKGDYVACYGSRSSAMIVAMLGVLKARACIVPIDADTWGQDRIRKTLEIAAPRLIVCTTGDEKNLDFNMPVLYFAMEELDMLLESDRSNGVEDSIPPQPPTGDDLAYTVFTSGTTGAPKGVMIRHSSLAHYVRQNEPHAPFNLNARVGSRVLLVYSVAFDACLGVIFSTICNGGTVVLATSTNYTDVAKTCTILPVTPSILATFGTPTEDYDNVQAIFLGGESLAPQVFSPWFNGRRRLFNCYGPTETTCASLIKELFPGSAPNILEHAVAQSTVILVKDGSDCDGEEGEILISGPGLALGYLGNEYLTASKFKTLRGTRFYCTGDYGRRIANSIHFLGRKDRTVKNRGFLINLDSEVEQPLSNLPGVGAVAAFMHNGHLVAFLTPETVNAASVKSQLQKDQDSFSIPERIYARQELPLTSNGKADIGALHTILDNNLLVPVQNGTTHEDSTEESPHEIVMRGFSRVLKVPMADLNEDSSFLGLGGNSLSAVGLVSYFRQQRYSCQVRQLFQLDTVRKISTSLTRIADEAIPRPQVTAVSLPEEAAALGVNLSDTETAIPMTAVQLKMIQSTLLQPTLNYIKVDMLFEHVGNDTLDTTRLRQAWTALCNRHSIFRLEFVPKLEIAVIRSAPDLEWSESHYSCAGEWQIAVDEADANWAEELKPLDPDRPRPRMNLSCYRQNGERTQLSWIVHHSMIDGWSVPLVLKELSGLLNDVSLSPAPQFSEAAIMQQQIRNHPTKEALQIWQSEKDKLCTIPKLGLPRASSQHRPGHRFQLTRRLGLCAREIQAFAKECLVSDMAVFLAAWGLVLSRYCDSDVVVCGAVLAGRNLPVDGADSIVGPLLSTLPISMNLSGKKDTKDAVFQVHEKLYKMNEVQWEFEKLASTLPSPPVLDTLVSLQYGLPEFEWPTTDRFPSPSSWKHTEMTELPIHVLIDTDETGALEARFLVDANFCDNFYASQMMDQFAAALRALPSLPSISNVVTGMLGQLDMNKLLFSFPDLHQPYHGSTSLKDAFEAVVDSWPDLVAVEAAHQSFTYSHLDMASNVVAMTLSDQAGRGDVVAILADGSPEWVIAILAVLKVGAAYCPVDISLPTKRIDTILTESQSKCLIKSSQKSLYRGETKISILTVEEILSKRDLAVLSERLPTVSRGRDCAVVIFTSGSTGKPKGISLEHIGILSLLDYPNARLRSQPGRRNAQFLSLGFDCCVNEVFATLCHGATFVLKDPENPMAHLRTVDAAMCTPSFLATLHPSEFPDLKLIALAGEPVPQKLVDTWSHSRTLLNVYSPSECTISAVYPELHPNKAVTLGRPVPRMAIYVLDGNLCPCPVGITGEIYLSGIQVTRGYLNLSNETKKRFIENPWIRGWTMYRSGDRGRLTADYEIEYLGRCDNQVKIRGYRVEMEEIESAILSTSTEVIQAVVVAHLDSLVAFVSPATVDTAEVSIKLNQQLPSYFQPSNILAINEMPMTANQKIDRRGLASSVETYLRECRQATVIAQPATATEKALQKIWKKVTRGEETEIGRFDRFNEIGGHSLLYQKVIRQIYAELGIVVPFRVAVENQVLSDLAQSIDKIGIFEDFNAKSVAILPKTANPDRGENQSVLASHLEREMYLIFKLAPNPEILNMVYVASIQDLDTEVLERSVSSVLSTNELLRSRFIEQDGQVVRKIEPPKANNVISKPVTNAHNEAKRLANQGLDPCDSLVQTYILQDESNTVLVIIMSHLVGDRASLSEMLAAIEAGYNENEAPQHRVSANSYCCWAQNQDDKKISPAQASFWDKFTKPCSPGQPVFGQFDASKAVYGSYTMKFDQAKAKALDKVQAEAGISGHHLATALIGRTIADLYERGNLIVAAPFRDSTSTSLEDDRFGLFLDRVVIPLQFDPSSATSIWQMVKEASNKAIANFLPFSKIKHLLGLSGKASALCEVMITYHDQPIPSLCLRGTPVRDITIRPRGVKFPLLFEVSKLKGTLQIDIDYDARIISESEVERIASKLKSVLQEAAAGETRTAALLSNSQPQHDTNGNRDIEDDALIDTVRFAMAKCLGLESQDVGASASFFDIGATSMDSLLLCHLLKKEGLQVTLGEILSLGTAELIAGSATLLK